MEKQKVALTLTTGIMLATLGEIKGAFAESKHIVTNASTDQEQKDTAVVTSKWEEVNGKCLKGKGKGFLGDTRILRITKANNQYYLQDTTREAKILTYDGQNRDDIRPILWRDSDNMFYESKDTVAVDAHHYMGVVYDYFKKKHGRNSYDNQGGTIKSYVRMGDFADAIGSGDGVVYGNGNEDDGIKTRGFSSSLDLIGHEFMHGVIGNSSKLIYENESGALNEAIADLFGTLIEHDYYKKANVKKKPNWNLSEDVYRDGKTMSRSMSNPGSAPVNAVFREALIDKDGKRHIQYPDHYSKLYKGTQDHGGVHFNSSIINKASYLLSEGGTHYGIKVKGIGKEKIGKIYYLAATEIFTESTNFIQARKGLEQAATMLYGSNSKELKSVKIAYNAVGIR
ncbi:M4 family metallopeptidase [Bacillus thuringiensis]|uniref:M4 family metallopeptidase n=1 Tax=Bacillus thuringiensis TaxID=1428 RepID=UPI001EE8D079|nr:M4 family metallopeptidase [Bacillus thuringiensis]MDZ3953395.1 M4 family metallopeptidase [Bacillus thuringiensis]